LFVGNDLECAWNNCHLTILRCDQSGQGMTDCAKLLIRRAMFANCHDRCPEGWEMLNGIAVDIPEETLAK